MRLEENPELAHWDTLARFRSEFSDGRVRQEISYKSVALSSRRDKAGRVVESVSGGPVILLEPPFESETRGGRKLSVRQISLFTWTTKMSCPSFSLPAGPTRFGGTCPAAVRSAVEREGTYVQAHESLARMPKGSVYICDVCYAGKKNYLIYKQVSVSQTVRLLWVNATLRNGTFIRRMTEAIAALQSPALEAMLGTKQVSPRFFRIHDSGDFHIPEYYRAWREICYSLPAIRFWAPTRMWVFARWREVFANYPPPINLSLRPSALFTAAGPPSVPGLAAGTTSIEGRMRDPVWNCPAYEAEEAHSCAAARCRVCWIRPQKAVNYLTH